MATATGNISVNVNLLLQVEGGEVQTIDVIDVPLPTRLAPDGNGGARLIVKTDDATLNTSIASALRRAASEFEKAGPSQDGPHFE